MYGVLVAERAASWDADDDVAGELGAVANDGYGLGALEAAVATVAGHDLVEVDEPALRAQIALLRTLRNRLDAHMTATIGELTRRERARARTRRPDDPRAGEQAARLARQQIVNELHLTHSEVKQAQRIGSQLAHAPTARAAFHDGTLGPRHTAVLADALGHVTDPDTHAQLETELTAAGQQMDPVEFGKLVRRRLGETDNDASVAAQRRRHQRRSGRVHLTEDGFHNVSYRGSGLDGETVATAVHAYRRHDAPGEHRTPEQTTHDAIVDMATAALAAADAPTQHGVRPHVVVGIEQADLDRATGIAHTTWSGPVPLSEVDRIIDDCSISRLVRDARGIPVEASEAVRTVPVGVWRGVVDRDRGCIADGCDHKPQWCQVMHLDTPYRLNGRLTIATAALGCSYHHRMLDHHGWTVTWHHGRPILHHPDKPPRPPDQPNRQRTPKQPPTRGDPP